MNEEKKGKRSIVTAFVDTVKRESMRRKSEKGALAADIGVFLVAFFLAGRHVAFGSYPLGAAFVAVLPSRVWIALVGAAVGSLSMGKAGIIHAAVVSLILFLRIIISAGAVGGEENLFSEPLIMKLSAATIGAFVGAGYEMLLSGFSFSSVLFGVFGIGFTLLFAFIFSGLFIADIKAADFLFGEKTLFLKRKERLEVQVILFQLSFAVICFLISLSLKKYDYFGISGAYLFSSALTLFISKRFGAFRGMAIGFISTLGISALYSPGFALVGAISGFLYSFGVGYALIGSGAALFSWSAYVGGMNGFLSVAVEFLIGAALVYRALLKAPTEKEEEVCDSLVKSAEEMVGASWLSREKKGGKVRALMNSLLSASDRIGALADSDSSSDFEEYRNICREVFQEENLPENQEIINKIATKLYKKQKIYDIDKEELAIPIDAFDKIEERCAEYERALYEKRKGGYGAEEYAAISKMISESLEAERDADAVNPILTESAREVFCRMGFPEGCIKVFGEEKIKVVGAGLDSDGRLITSPELKTSLEEALGYKLGSYEYFRRGDMALFTASAVPAFEVDCATYSKSAATGEASGDCSRFFSSESVFFSLVSDGMGTGREARLVSDFVSSYLSDMLSAEVGIAGALSSLNRLLRQREAESSSTVDLFSFNLLSGEAVFTKCGAAPSYVKRGKSIFRIRSESAPLGVIPTLDAEKIRVEVKSGDSVIMLSDGVSASATDAAWLLSFLSKEEVGSAEEYAKRILELAVKNSHSRDDMTVSVITVTSK